MSTEHNKSDSNTPIEIIDESSTTSGSSTHFQDGDKTMAMLCHLLSLCLFVLPSFGNIIGPLILWLVKKDEDPFVDATGKEVLNFQISVTIYGIVCFLLVFAFGLGILLGMILSIAMVVLTIVGALKANEGELYRYPFTIRFLK